MDIKDRIKKIGEYFKEMQIVTVDGNQVIYVVVSFPHGWIIDDDIEEKFGVTVNEGTVINEYYFCADIDSGENTIFDAIDYNIEKMKDAIERAQLLNTKIKELKDIFQDENISLTNLRGLSFVYAKENDNTLISTFQTGATESEVSEDNFIASKRGRKSKNEESNKEDKK